MRDTKVFFPPVQGIQSRGLYHWDTLSALLLFILKQDLIKLPRLNSDLQFAFLGLLNSWNDRHCITVSSLISENSLQVLCSPHQDTSDLFLELEKTALKFIATPKTQNPKAVSATRARQRQCSGRLRIILQSHSDKTARHRHQNSHTDQWDRTEDTDPHHCDHHFWTEEPKIAWKEDGLLDRRGWKSRTAARRRLRLGPAGPRCPLHGLI